MALTKNDNKGHRIIHITGTTATPSSIFTDDKFIDRIVWDGPSTAGHKLSILTGNDKPFYGWTCSVTLLRVDVFCQQRRPRPEIGTVYCRDENRRHGLGGSLCLLQ